MRNVNFVAIDFEWSTATKMICQVGIVQIEHGEITFEKSLLIRPPMNKHDSFQKAKNGITEKDTFEAPSFKEAWPEIEPYLIRNTVVCHSIGADIDALEKNCAFYKIEMPRFLSIVDTQKIFNCGLEYVCKQYNIELEHHNALSDAKGCALAFLEYLKGASPVIAVERKTDNRVHWHKKIRPDLLIPDLKHADSNSPLYNKKVVITGKFDSFPERDDLAAIVKKMGANINTTISKFTDFVFMGINAGPKKIKDIEKFKSLGAKITVCNEPEILKMIEKYR